jgi:hypothetical protein
MNRINNPDGRAARRARRSNRFAYNEVKRLLRAGRRAQWKTGRRSKALATWVAPLLLLFGPCAPLQAGLLKADVDFSNYDKPLFEQIVNHIKDKVAGRLGQGVNTQDRYFIVPFAFQKKWNNPQFSHSFISVIRVFGDGKQPNLTPGLRRGQVKNREFEAFTISWVPHDFGTNPVCVFGGFGSRIFPTWNTCPIVVGRNFRLDETLKVALNDKSAVGMWGPYEIRKAAFDLGVKRKLLLDGGTYS